jgi:outer membrane protein assembly factor BamB
VYAIDAKTGARRWAFKTGDMVEAPPLVHDGRVFIGSADFFLYALDAKTGELAWKFETQDKILGGANWHRSADGTTRIVVGSYDARVYAFDAKSGAKLWEYETDNYVNGTPAIANGEMVFGGCDAALHLVTVADGAGKARVELGGDCHVAGSVAIAGDRAFFGHYGNAFVCIDLETGATVWSYPSKNHGFFSSPALDAERVVFGGRDRKLHCVKRGDGKPLWAFSTKRKVDSSPVICGDKVVFGSGDGRLYLVSLADGAELWNYDLGRAIVSSPAVAGGLIVIGSSDDNVYAFRASSEQDK